MKTLSKQNRTSSLAFRFNASKCVAQCSIRAVFRDDWLITGDVGRIDAGEYLIISDRSKDLVKSGGEWISSVDLENHLAALDGGVAQACVVAQPHPKWDERPVALIVRAENVDIGSEEVVAHCATRFARWQLPGNVVFADAIRWAPLDPGQ